MKILVPLDGSPFAERALPVAVWLAERLDADVHLFSAVPTVEELVARDEQLAEYQIPGRCVEREVVVDLDPAGAIHEALRRLGDAVACMASHGRGRSAALIGSVATEVVARGRDPLIVVGPLIDERFPGSNVLACVDETPGSAVLLPIAQRWAGLLREPLVVVTVAEPVPPAISSGPVRRLFGPDGDVDAYLEALVRPIRREGADVKTLALYDPISPAEGLRTYLREHPATLVVIGSRARRGLARMVFGSTSATIVHGSASPVLVAPRPDTR
jgi:nucleotide-binding universal stress UspA family protein